MNRLGDTGLETLLRLSFSNLYESSTLKEARNRDNCFD